MSFEEYLDTVVGIPPQREVVVENSNLFVPGNLYDCYSPADKFLGVITVESEEFWSHTITLKDPFPKWLRVGVKIGLHKERP